MAKARVYEEMEVAEGAAQLAAAARRRQQKLAAADSLRVVAGARAPVATVLASSAREAEEARDYVAVAVAAVRAARARVRAR